MSDVLRQIDEDLRKDKLNKLWKNYGLYIIVLIITIILAVIGYQIKVSSDKSSNQKLVETFLATSNNEDIENVLNNFDIIINSNNNYLSGLAELKKSNLLIKNGNYEDGLFVLKKVINNKKYDPVINDLATYLLLMLLLEDLNDNEFSTYLSKDKIETSKLKFLFMEIKAIRNLILGDFEQAKKEFIDLKNTIDLPIEIRTRAGKFLELAEKNE